MQSFRPTFRGPAVLTALASAALVLGTGVASANTVPLPPPVAAPVDPAPVDPAPETPVVDEPSNPLQDFLDAIGMGDGLADTVTGWVEQLIEFLGGMIGFEPVPADPADPAEPAPADPAEPDPADPTIPVPPETPVPVPQDPEPLPAPAEPEETDQLG